MRERLLVCIRPGRRDRVAADPERVRRGADQNEDGRSRPKAQGNAHGRVAAIHAERRIRCGRKYVRQKPGTVKVRRLVRAWNKPSSPHWIKALQPSSSVLLLNV